MGRAMGTMLERRAAAWPSPTDSRNSAKRRRAIKDEALDRHEELLAQFESRAAAAGRDRRPCGGCRGGLRLHLRSRAGAVRRPGRQGEVDDLGGDPPWPRSGGARGDRRRGRPGRADHPTGRRTPQPSRGSRHPQEQGRDHPAASPRRWASPTRRRMRRGLPGWCETICASTSCSAGMGITGANFAIAETGSHRPGRERGQRQSDHSASSRPCGAGGPGEAHPAGWPISRSSSNCCPAAPPGRS